jgi:hypothetical protein
MIHLASLITQLLDRSIPRRLIRHGLDLHRHAYRSRSTRRPPAGRHAAEHPDEIAIIISASFARPLSSTSIMCLRPPREQRKVEVAFGFARPLSLPSSSRAVPLPCCRSASHAEPLQRCRRQELVLSAHGSSGRRSRVRKSIETVENDSREVLLRPTSVRSLTLGKGPKQQYHLLTATTTLHNYVQATSICFDSMACQS